MDWWKGNFYPCLCSIYFPVQGSQSIQSFRFNFREHLRQPRYETRSHLTAERQEVNFNLIIWTQMTRNYVL